MARLGLMSRDIGFVVAPVIMTVTIIVVMVIVVMIMIVIGELDRAQHEVVGDVVEADEAATIVGTEALGRHFIGEGHGLWRPHAAPALAFDDEPGLAGVHPGALFGLVPLLCLRHVVDVDRKDVLGFLGQ